MMGLEMHEAASLGDYDSLEDHINSGKYDINQRDPDWKNKTPLHWASGKGREYGKKGREGETRILCTWYPGKVGRLWEEGEGRRNKNPLHLGMCKR